MKTRIFLNLMFATLAIWIASQGFAVPRLFTFTPCLIAVVGFIAGCAHERGFAVATAVCSIASALALWLAMFFSMATVPLLIMGSAATAVERANSDALRLGVLGTMSLISGVIAVSRLRKLPSDL